MKAHLHILFAISAILLAACQEEEDLPKTCFGECSYYPSFFWSDADTCGVTKHLYLDFSDDAKEDEEAFAEITFVDKECNAIPDDILEITIDGVVIKDNTFKVYSTETEKEVKLRFLPKAESGNHQGYIKLVSYSHLDRFEDLELSGGPVKDMSRRWDLYFNKCMNPLAKVMMWIGILAITLLTIWFHILRPILFPRFKTVNKMFNIPGYAPLVVRMRGARMVVISDKSQKDSFWNALVKGPVLYKTHPAFHAPVTLLPSKMGIVVKADFSKYRVSVNPIPRIGACEITDINNNLKITVS